ncbi:MAG TPA: ABC transporter permease [Terriglobales bacterium]|nr:ABC transporter permease [Terriglobales bacterium]
MNIVQDVRYGTRVLTKSPVITLVMVLILGIGIGATTAIFSFVNAIFLKPAAVSRPDELVKVFARGPHGGHGAGFSYPEYISLRDHNSSFQSLAAETQIAQIHTVLGDGATEMRADFVSSNYFSTLRVRPLIGRFFLPEEDAVPDRNPVAVISAELWRQHFRSDPGVVNRTVTVNRVRFQIVGVAAPQFSGIHTGDPQALWMPVMMLHTAAFFGTCPHEFDCSVIDDFVGRLAPGRTRRDAEDELSRIVAWSASDWPASAGRREIVTVPAAGVDPDARADFSLQMKLLMSVAALLLLVSCANLAGLFLARSVSRSREIAVRLSIGASRFRIARQLMTESVLLAVLSCLVGLALSIWAGDALAGFYNVDSEGFRHVFDLGLDKRVLLFSFGVTIVTSVLFGLFPAIRASKQDLVTQLKEGAGAAGSRQSGRLRQCLVAGQVALSLVLLASAGLLVRSSQALLRGTNFDPEHVAVLRVRPELLNYTPQQNEEFFPRLTGWVASLPGVQAVTWVRGGEGLIWEWSSGRPVYVNRTAAATEPLEVKHHDIGLNFFSTLKIPLIEGRDFNEQDSPKSAPVAIVNETLARRLWPDGSILGRNVIINNRPVQVVGVARDIQPQNSLTPSAPYLFLPFWQSDPGKEGDIRLAVRVKGDPDSAIPALRRAVQELDPNLPVGEDMSMVKQIETQYMPVMLSRLVISCCGVIALCLSAIGLFSVLTYSVRTRTREIGVRMALGAQIGALLRMIVREGLTTSLVGIGAGVILALATTRLLAAWLFGLQALDFLAFAGAASVLLLVAAAASYLPARTAAAVDPMVALRQE